MHPFGPVHGKPRNFNKAGVLLTHQSISTHIFIPFLLELEVRDVSVVGFLVLPFFPVTFNLHMTGLLVFCLLGFSLVFVGFSKTVRVFFIKNYILFKENLTIAVTFKSVECVWTCPGMVFSSFKHTSLM